MSYTHDIIIIGAGIAGSTMALAAGTCGLRVALLDKQIPTNMGDEINLRVSNINFSSEQFLKTLGVSLPSDRCGFFKHIRVFQEGCLDQLEFSAQNLGIPYLGRIIENNVLINHVQRLFSKYAIDTLWPVTLDEIEFTAQSVSLPSQKISAPLIIGAVGTHAKLREQCGIFQDEKSYQQTAMVAHIATQQPHLNTAYQRFLMDGPLAYLPLSNPHQCSIVWSSTPAHIEQLMALADQELAQEIATGLMHQLGNVELISARATFPLVMRHAKRYIAPRVAFIGDAIHTIHPLAGQGANLGIMDAESLMQALIFAQEKNRDIGHLTVLRRYERQRRFANTLMVQSMQLLANNQPPFSTLRTLGMRLACRSNVLKRLMMQGALSL